MASYTAILPPPQSLDDLNAWGSLDALPWSLDSAVWNTAGLYALALAATASTGQTCGALRMRTDTLTGAAVSGGTMAGVGVLDLGATGAGTSREDVIGGITVDIPLDAATATSAAMLNVTRIRPGLLAGEGATEQELTPYRVRTDALAEAALADALLVFWRVRTLAGTGAGAAMEALWPEYKGWTWQEEAGPLGADAWSPLPGVAQNWTRISGGDAVWRGVVQWQ